MLATLFDFPFEDRRKLTCWSDMSRPASPMPDGPVDARGACARANCSKCLDYFTRLWNERVNAPPRRRPDLDAGARRSDARTCRRMEYLGNLILLIVGGNDTTRNSITGGVSR